MNSERVWHPKLSFSNSKAKTASEHGAGWPADSVVLTSHDQHAYTSPTPRRQSPHEGEGGRDRPVPRRPWQLAFGRSPRSQAPPIAARSRRSVVASGGGRARPVPWRPRQLASGRPPRSQALPVAARSRRSVVASGGGCARPCHGGRGSSCPVVRRAHRSHPRQLTAVRPQLLPATAAALAPRCSIQWLAAASPAASSPAAAGPVPGSGRRPRQLRPPRSPRPSSRAAARRRASASSEDRARALSSSFPGAAENWVKERDIGIFGFPPHPHANWVFGLGNLLDPHFFHLKQHRRRIFGFGLGIG